MKKSNNIVSKIILVLFSLYIINYTYADDDCEKKTDSFEKYECRTKKVCEVPEYVENKKVFNPEKFKKADSYKEAEISDVFLKSSRDEKPIKKAVSVYKDNMDSIYKCAMIWIQKNSILNIKQKLLSANLDKTWDVKKNIWPKIESILNKLDIVSKSSKCLEIDKKTIYNKLAILKQTTQVTCDYGFYIDYLKEYYKDPMNAMWIDPKDIKDTNASEETKSYLNSEVANKLKNIQSDLDSELEHSLKIFPIAFHAYSEYENNFPIHFLLELIKEDYMIFRDKLYEVLNPINQVVYKISNAMKK